MTFTTTLFKVLRSASFTTVDDTVVKTRHYKRWECPQRRLSDREIYGIEFTRRPGWYAAALEEASCQEWYFDDQEISVDETGKFEATGITDQGNKVVASFRCAVHKPLTQSDILD